MKRKLTEIEAWEFCAKAFEGAFELLGDYVAKVEIGGHTHTDCNGICDVLKTLVQEYRLGFELMLKMTSRIEKLKTIAPLDGYVWHKSAKGAKQRVAFCNRQIKRLKGKKK